ncbi:MAG: thermonuclease family protein [Deltaproteobacteria bacterium]|nr:thermonuclease family protein [Deltaproteobacteria bacterium]
MKKATLYLTALLLLATTPAHACQGKVVGVADGDTITVMHNGRGEKIRLYGVDTPEKKQDFGQRAKQFTSDMACGKIVDVEPIAIDRYGRTVGIVRIGGKRLNEELYSIQPAEAL